MSQTKIYLLTVLIFAIYSAYAVASPSEAPDDLTREEQTILTVVGYVGIADFCWAYGVDYRETAHQVKQSIIEDADEQGSRMQTLVEFGFESAAIGNIYSSSIGDMVTLLDSSNIQQACDNMYVQFQRITRIK